MVSPRRASRCTGTFGESVVSRTNEAALCVNNISLKKYLPVAVFFTLRFNWPPTRIYDAYGKHPVLYSLSHPL